MANFGDIFSWISKRVPALGVQRPKREKEMAADVRPKPLGTPTLDSAMKKSFPASANAGLLDGPKVAPEPAQAPVFRAPAVQPSYDMGETPTPFRPFDQETLDLRVKKAWAGFKAAYPDVDPSPGVLMAVASHPKIPTNGIFNAFPIEAREAISAIGRAGNAALGVVDTLQKPVANFAIDVLTEPGRRAEEQRRLVDKAYGDNAPGWQSAMRAAGPKAMLTEEQRARLSPAEQQRLNEIEEANMLDYVGMGGIDDIGRAGRLAVGKLVKAADRENFGTILSMDNEAKTALVRFINKAEGTQAEVSLPLDQLSTLAGKEAAETAGYQATRYERKPGPWEYKDRASQFEGAVADDIERLETSRFTQREVVAAGKEGVGRFVPTVQKLKAAAERGELPLDEVAAFRRGDPLEEVKFLQAKYSISSADRRAKQLREIGRTDEAIALEKQIGEAISTGFTEMAATGGGMVNVQKVKLGADNYIKAYGKLNQYLDTISGPMTEGQKAKYEALRAELMDAADNVPSRTLKDALRGFLAGINEFGVAAKLTQGVTHAANFVSNAANVAVVRPLEKAVGNIADPKQMRYVYGTRAGWASGVKKFVEVMLDESKATWGKEGYRGRGAIPGAVGRAVRIPFRMLAASDDLFKSVLRDSELHMGALDLAREEGFKGAGLKKRIAEIVERPPDDLWQRADAHAREFLFQADMSKRVEAVANAIGEIPILGKATVPFVQTPTNIVKFYGQRSPWGLASIKNWSDLAAGGIKRKEAAGRLVVGMTTSVGSLLWASEAYQNGNITGSLPDKPAERKAFYDQGRKPWSIKIGDKWIDYRRIQPAGMYLAQAMSLLQALENEEADSAAEKFAAMAFVGAEAIREIPFVEGLNNLLNALTDPGRLGEKYLARVGTGFIPTIVQGMAKYKDDTVRDPQKFVDYFKAVLPGMSEEVPPQISTFGEESKWTEKPGVRGFFNVMSTERNDPLLNELERLDHFPGIPERKLSPNVELDDKEYANLLKTSGKAFAKGLKELTGAKEYQALPDVDKIKEIEKITRSSREGARTDALSRRLPVLTKFTKEQAEWDGDLKDASSYQKLKARPIWRKAVRPWLASLAKQKNQEAAEGWRLFLSEWDERNEDIGDWVSPDSPKFPQNIWDFEIGKILSEHPAFALQFEMIPERYLTR